MRLSPIVLSALLATFALSTSSAQAPRPGQAPPGKPQQQPAPPPIAAAKPYKAIAVTLPAPLNDPSFEAFRKQLADTAKRKDRAGLAKLVVAQGFFWEGDKGDRAAKNKPGIDNLSTAIGLGAKQGWGWDILMGQAADPTAMPYPERQGVVCAPADPTFNAKEFEEVFKATQTQPDEWGYAVKDGIEVRSGPQANTPVVEKLGLHLVRVVPEEPPPGQPPRQAPAQNAPPPNEIPAMKIVTPSGKTGFIPADALAPLGNDQLCYVKDAGGVWKIAGYVGGDQP
jgi:hypothetical protein